MQSQHITNTAHIYFLFLVSILLLAWFMLWLNHCPSFIFSLGSSIVYICISKKHLKSDMPKRRMLHVPAQTHLTLTWLSPVFHAHWEKEPFTFQNRKLAIISAFLLISRLTSDPLPRPYSSALKFYLETIFTDSQPTGTDKYFILHTAPWVGNRLRIILMELHCST